MFEWMPTVQHESVLSKKKDEPGRVFFLNWGAPIAHGATFECNTPSPRARHEGNCSSSYVLVGPASLAQMVAPAPQRMGLLKMDCEGCEYSIYADVMRREPSFFERVEQVVLEVHLPRRFAPTDAAFLDYGRLLVLLLRAGHRLMHFEHAYCSGGSQFEGMTPLVAESGYYQRFTSLPRERRPRMENQCENVLFSRVS